MAGACALLWALTAAPATAQAVADAPTTPMFRLELAPAEATVGDSVKAVLRCNDAAKLDGQVLSVAFADVGEDWEVEAPWTREVAQERDGMPGPWSARLRPFAVGTLAVPDALIRYQTKDGAAGEMRLTSTTLVVNSVRPAGARGIEMGGLRDLAEIRARPDWLPWATAASALLLAALLYRFFRRPRKPRPAREQPQLPPGLWALQELERRSRLPVCRTGPAKTIYSMAAEVMRIYLTRRYGIPALDMTSRECAAALRAWGADASVLEWLGEFFDECDMVKFSGFATPQERWATVWNDAKLIVQRSTPAAELADVGDGAVGRPLAAEAAS